MKDELLRHHLKMVKLTDYIKMMLTEGSERLKNSCYIWKMLDKAIDLLGI